jgi:YggT family protein
MTSTFLLHASTFLLDSSTLSFDTSALILDRNFLLKTVLSFINIYSTIIFVRLLLTWFPAIDWMQQIATVLSPVTDPYLNIFRNIIPPVGNFDLSPMLAIFALSAIGSVIPMLFQAFN